MNLTVDTYTLYVFRYTFIYDYYKISQIIRDLGYDMTVQEFSSKIREDPTNFYNTSEDLVAGFEKITYEMIPPRLPKLFSNIPKTKLK